MLQGDSLFIIRALTIDGSRQNNVILAYTLFSPEAPFWRYVLQIVAKIDPS